MPTLKHTFTSAAQLGTIQTDITGAETATLTESDYSETNNGDGTYTYNGTYEATADGDYTFTLTTADTLGGISATWGGQSTVYTVSSLSDNVVTQYEFEDDSDTTTATDSIGSNDADIVGASYTTTAKVGSLALDYTTDDYTVSQSSVDLVNSGPDESAAVMCWINPNSTSNTGGYYIAQRDENASTDEVIGIQDQGGTVRGVLQVNSNFEVVTGEISVPTDAWTHVYFEVTQSDGTLKVGGSSGTSDSGTHSANITNIGSQRLTTGGNVFKNYVDAQIDDAVYAESSLTDPELDAIVDRGN